jgi:hypothetical protein
MIEIMSEHQARGPHRWRKGQPSPNPQGRPPGPLTFAERTRRRVDPDRLIDRALAIVDDAEASDRDRIAAMTFLHGAGWTKPAERHEIAAVTAEDEDAPDLSQLSDADLDRLAALEDERDRLLSGAALRALPAVTGG